jgi:ABC-2 type transport system permease protein
MVSGALIFIPLLVAMPVIGHYLTFPLDGWRFAIGIPAIVLSALVQFSIAYCFGLLTFWFLEIQGFVILSMAIETVLGGQIFPLDLLPEWIFRIAQFLPFFYQMYFPAAIFTGRMELPMALQGLVIQVGWVAILLLINHVLWVRGLRRHTAVGG